MGGLTSPFAALTALAGAFPSGKQAWHQLDSPGLRSIIPKAVPQTPSRVAHVPPTVMVVMMMMMMMMEIELPAEKCGSAGLQR